MRRSALLLASATLLAACSRGTPTNAPSPSGPPKVGPANGTVIVVGGGAQGPELWARFIEAAGGPDALIVDVPTAGGDSIDVAAAGKALRDAGARNVVVYHTTSKQQANDPAFVAKIANAKGIWFDGGRHYRLVDSYLGTRSQQAFEAVLARGGVVGGTSAGASILGDYLVRGAPSSNNNIVNHPQYLKGFAYLKNTAVDQHVVARLRLPDLHDSLTSKRPDLLAISEDEGTSWVVRGDQAEIIGRNKAFVYNGRDPNDAGRPFLTLHPGDRYDLAARRLISRAASGTKLTPAFVDGVFAAYRDPAKGGATVVVAQAGKVLVNKAYGVPPQPRYMPETGMPNVPLAGLGAVLASSMTGSPTPASLRRVLTLGGAQRLQYDSTSRAWSGNVDDLYRVELGRFVVAPGARDTNTVPSVFTRDVDRGLTRYAVYGTAAGQQAAWVRYPEQRAVVIILTKDPNANAKAMAQQLADQLLR
jgi:cyanophycinase